MRKETAELIMVLKGNHNIVFTGKWDYKILIKRYLSIRSGTKEKYILYQDIFKYVESCVLDYARTLQTTASFLYDFFDCYLFYPDELDRWCAALARTQVKDDNGYINGWSEELLKPFDKDKYEK